MNQPCPLHPSKSVSWICLDRNCSSRVMCSICAVKNHAKEHQIEEVEAFQQKGLLKLITNMIKKCTVSKAKKDLNVSKLNKKEENLSLEWKEMLELLEKNISQVLVFVKESIKKVEQEFEEQLKRERNEKYLAIQIIGEYENKAKIASTISEIQENIDKAIEVVFKIQSRSLDKEEDDEEVVNEFCDGCDQCKDQRIRNQVNLESSQKIRVDLGENTPISKIVYLKKKSLMSQLQSYFLELTKSYLKNPFTQEFCLKINSYVEAVLASHEKAQLDHLDGKWKTDFLLLQETLASSLSQLVARVNGYSGNFTAEAFKRPIEQNSRIQILSNNVYHHNPVAPTPYQFIQPQQIIVSQSLPQTIHQFTTYPQQGNLNQIEEISNSHQQFYSYRQFQGSLQVQPAKNQHQAQMVHLQQQGYGQQRQQQILNQQPQQAVPQSIQSPFYQIGNRVQSHPQNIPMDIRGDIITKDLSLTKHRSTNSINQLPTSPVSKNIQKNVPQNNSTNTPQSKNLLEKNMRFIQTTPFSHQENQGRDMMFQESQGIIESINDSKKLQNTSEGQGDPLSPIHFIQKKANP